MKKYMDLVKIFIVAFVVYVVLRTLYLRYEGFNTQYMEHMSEYTPSETLPGLQGLDKNFLKLLNPGANMESFYGYVPNFSSDGVRPADTERTELMGESLGKMAEGLMMKDDQTDRGVWWGEDGGETPYAIGPDSSTIG